jgi:hypothetical protein
MFPQQEKRSMKPHMNLKKERNAAIPCEMERAKYWADLLYRTVDKYDIYIIAKYNLYNTNKNSIKQENAKKILEDAIKRYEEIYHP